MYFYWFLVIFSFHQLIDTSLQSLLVIVNGCASSVLSSHVVQCGCNVLFILFVFQRRDSNFWVPWFFVILGLLCWVRDGSRSFLRFACDKLAHCNKIFTKIYSCVSLNKIFGHFHQITWLWKHSSDIMIHFLCYNQRAER